MYSNLDLESSKMCSTLVVCLFEIGKRENEEKKIKGIADYKWRKSPSRQDPVLPH
jgi:hypothetical protein